MNNGFFRKTNMAYVFPGDPAEYPVVEATKGTMSFPTSEDVKQAKRNDPYRCAIACNFKRAFGARHAYVAGTVAYIVGRVNKTLCAIQYKVPGQTRKKIIRFDKTGAFPQDGFYLAPVPVSCGRKAVAKRNKKLLSRYVNGKYVPIGKSRPNTAKRHAYITFRHHTRVTSRQVA